MVVVTPDPRVAEEAAALGAEPLLRDDPGLNAALDAGARHLVPRGLDALLVVLGDVPGGRPEDVAQLFEALRGLGGRGVVLAPSRDGGTSALLRAPWDVIPNRFGKDSAAAHREAARAADASLRELPPRLAGRRPRPRRGRRGPVRRERCTPHAGAARGARLPGRADEPRGAAARAARACRPIAPGDDLAAALAAAAQRPAIALRGGVLVVCQKVVSKQEGRLVVLAEVEPSEPAVRIAQEHGKDPRQIEVILRETRRIVRRGHGVLICETHHGFVCANAGVDLSNAPADGVAVLLPLDPDASARRLRAELLAQGAGEPLGVVVSDTFGRPWREGLVDVAIGCAGLRPLDDWRGRSDLRGARARRHGERDRGPARGGGGPADGEGRRPAGGVRGPAPPPQATALPASCSATRRSTCSAERERRLLQIRSDHRLPWRSLVAEQADGAPWLPGGRMGPSGSWLGRAARSLRRAQRGRPALDFACGARPPPAPATGLRHERLTSRRQASSIGVDRLPEAGDALAALRRGRDHAGAGQPDGAGQGVRPQAAGAGAELVALRERRTTTGIPRSASQATRSSSSSLTSRRKSWSSTQARSTERPAR